MPLNANQRRSLSVTLRVVENALVTVEGLLRCPPTGALTRATDPVGPEVEPRLREALADLQADVLALAHLVNVAPGELPVRGRAAALLISAWEAVCDSHPSRLRAYGAVDEDVNQALAGPMARLADRLLEAHSLLMQRQADSGGGYNRPHGG